MRRLSFLFIVFLTIAILPASRANAETPAKGDTRHIIVHLLTQRMEAYEHGRLLYASDVSTGIVGWDTPIGEYHVWAKRIQAEMIGPGYDLPAVPWIMYYDGDRALHGTYWHHHFGYVMSHGCVNLPTDVASELYHWADVGTWVSIVP